MYGPASFARALMTGAKIDAFAIETNLDGTKGYYSVFYVKKDSPYQKIEDLKGKNLGLVDPNSTSGNNVPRFVLDGMKIEPETFFSKVVYTGSHENAVIALGQGTVDVAANWWNDEQESNLLRMARKNMVKAEIRDAVLNLATKDRVAFDKIYEGKQGPLQAVDNKAYDPIIELNKFVDALRKKKSS
jgi:phosphonate transport system substrate-binding protein